jgi:hypothetical protein
MLFITGILGSHEFGFRIGQGAQGSRQISAARTYRAGGTAVLSTVSEGLKIVFSDFDVDNAMRKCEFLRKVDEIVIGGVRTVLEIRLTCLFMSLG